MLNLIIFIKMLSVIMFSVIMIIVVAPFNLREFVKLEEKKTTASH